MNGRYEHASSPEERMAIAVVAAIHSYFIENPQGVAPGQGFIQRFLKPFIDREIIDARISECDNNPHPGDTHPAYLRAARAKIMAECDKLIKHDGGKYGQL